MLRTLREVVKRLSTWIVTFAFLSGSTIPSIANKFFIEDCSLDDPLKNCRGLVFDASSHAVAEDPAVDKLVFGSFRNPENASNLAVKLSHLLNTNIRVESVHTDNGIFHRVTTVAVAQETLNAASRVADSHGLTYWRILLQQQGLTEWDNQICCRNRVLDQRSKHK